MLKIKPTVIKFKDGDVVQKSYVYMLGDTNIILGKIDEGELTVYAWRPEVGKVSAYHKAIENIEKKARHKHGIKGVKSVNATADLEGDIIKVKEPVISEV